MTGKGLFKKYEYVYDEYYDCYICPNNEVISYFYNRQKWIDNYPQRKETIERVFGDCKEQHNLRFTRIRGLLKNEQNTTIIFACHNLKKMANWRWKTSPNKSRIRQIINKILQIAKKEVYYFFYIPLCQQSEMIE